MQLETWEPLLAADLVFMGSQQTKREKRPLNRALVKPGGTELPRDNHDA